MTENPMTVGGVGSTDTYSYPAAGDSNPHAVQSIMHVVVDDPSSSTYSYDASGNTTGRPAQTLDYDATGRLNTVTDGTDTQSNVYDADGDLLLQTDSSSGSTLFLGPTELHADTAGDPATATRTYEVGSISVAERSTTVGSSTPTQTWLCADAEGTVGLEVDATTGALNARQQDPFGNARGTSSTWSDDHGYLNATTSALTGLTQLGARLYDSTIGKFLSVDPVLDPGDPQQNNGYSYSQDDPVGLSDPSGLDPHAEYCEMGCHQDTYLGVTRLVNNAPSAAARALEDGCSLQNPHACKPDLIPYDPGRDALFTPDYSLVPFEITGLTQQDKQNWQDTEDGLLSICAGLPEACVGGDAMKVWDFLTFALGGSDEARAVIKDEEAETALDAVLPSADRAGPKPELDIPGISNSYIDVTTGHSVRNVRTEVTHDQFVSNLASEWTYSVSKDGTAQIFHRGGAKYVLRSKNSSGHSGWTADFTPAGSARHTLEIRLGYTP